MIPTLLHNYWTPLASQVEELDDRGDVHNITTPPDHLLLVLHPTTPRITFNLSPHHINKDSTNWQRGCPPDNRTAYWANPLAAMRIGVLNGTVPLAVSNMGATSSAFLAPDSSLPTECVSMTVFHLPNGAVTPATTINQIHHDVRAPAREVNIVPSLAGHSLLST